MLDFNALGGGDGSGGSVLEPRKIFTTLIRNQRLKFLSDNQGEVLDKWFAKKERKDNTIKMNTGSGKMIVGLLILRSSLNDGKGPALYVTVDNYLVEQVISEALDLGLQVTRDPRSAAYLSGESICVVTVDKLINGMSIFGVGAQGVLIPVGSVVIDDAHACLGAVEDQFKIKLPLGHPAHVKLLSLFEESLKNQSNLGVVEVKGGDPNALMVVPFWAWADKEQQVLEILHSHRMDGELKFSWPLLKNVIKISRCVFGGRSVEISPRCLPIDELPSFSSAKRRIYMTATLADDGILVERLRADAEAVADPLKPKGAGEIGDRMIIVPQELNANITESDVKSLALDVAKTRNVVVIVPSAKRSEVWRDVAAQILNKDNISDGIAQLKKPGAHIGITVLVNRYDGVDLPDDACRLLIIDGLPEVSGLIERLEEDALQDTEKNLLRQMQRLEQGMGRGVRSGEDRCAVLLLGSRLAQHINYPSARAMLTPATFAQMEMGREMTRQLKGKPITELRPILDLCIEQNTEDGKRWWQAGRSRLANAPEGKPAHIDPSVVRVRHAFDKACAGQFRTAAGDIQEAINSEKDQAIKGHLKQQLAEYMHHYDPTKAQETLLSALADNRRVLKPLAGITYAKIGSPVKGQARSVGEFISSRFIDGNFLVLFVNALLEDLGWDKNRTDKFEASMLDAGRLLGFGSQRPDKEYHDGGPDNLWAIGELRFLVIECKSGVDLDGRLISKDHCNQLLGAISWFERSYDRTCLATPILVHPMARFQREASPSPAMRIMDTECLGRFKVALRAFAAALAASPDMTDEAEIAKHLLHLKLTGNMIINAFSTTYTVEV